MKLDFDKLQGLVPTVVQDFASGEVLMLGYMNPAALKVNLTDLHRGGLIVLDTGPGLDTGILGWSSGEGGNLLLEDGSLLTAENDDRVKLEA